MGDLGKGGPIKRQENRSLGHGTGADRPDEMVRFVGPGRASLPSHSKKLRRMRVFDPNNPARFLDE